MKLFCKKLLILALALLLILTITACGKGPISIDKNGYATWKPISGAVKYECAEVDGAYCSQGTFFLTEPGYQLREGYSLHIRPVFSDGSTGHWSVSDYYGESAYDKLKDRDGDFDPNAYVSLRYDVRFDQLERFELISAIRWDTVRTREDGLLSFEADGPHGIMRFEAKGVTAENGQLIFQPGARIWGLDAIGRICAMHPAFSNPGDVSNLIFYSGGYTFSDVTSVESYKDLMYVWGQGITTGDVMGGAEPVELMNWQPNFIIFGSDSISVDAFTVSALEIYYDTTTFTTGIQYMALDSNFYGTYLTGDRYDPEREIYDLDANILNFYLCAIPQLQNELVPYEPDPKELDLSRSIIAFTPEQFETGALRRADGTEIDRSAPLEEGMTLDVTVGDYTFPVALPVNPQFRGAQNMNQLVPYGYPEATGTINAIMIPVAWQDQPERANDGNLLPLKAAVGRVIENGEITDYSEQLADDNRFSLSKYFDIASHEKLNISTFVTDWFIAPFDYSQYQNEPTDNEAFRDAIYNWLMSTYPDMDWTPYDKDGNGYFDAVMFINVGSAESDLFYPWSFSGGVHHLLTYNGGKAGTPEKPAFNGFINVNASLLPDNTLIHEFGHNLGLIDYYDVSYSGIDAVGCFDMQASNYGDWNAYSKYAAGWIEPTVVELAPGESKEYTIGASCDTGDAIVIPVHSDTFDGPFNEYILVDLFTDGGVNVHDVANFGLGNTSGVRIYHVDARMETHIEEANGVSYPLGTPAHVNAYTPAGDYHIELIQAGGTNTFTNLAGLGLDGLRNVLRQEDLFQAGMSFSTESHSEFFRNGKMDDGCEFPYTIEIVSANAQQAVIRISAK